MTFKKILFKAATLAGKIQLRHFGKLQAKDIRYKKNKEFVTYVDTLCSRLISAEIKKHYPKHAVISEEAAIKKVKSDYSWYIDPLDGTTNYSIGHPIFAVTIAVDYCGKTVESLIYLPFLRQYYYAEKKLGAFLNGRCIRVSSQANLGKSLLAVNIAHNLPAYRQALEVFRKTRPFVNNLRVFGSCSYSACMVAAGRMEALLMAGASKPWDVKPGRLLVNEAGGRVTDFKGRTDGQDGLLMSNGQIHQQVLKKLK